jgi:carboxypeptidase Q
MRRVLALVALLAVAPGTAPRAEPPPAQAVVAGGRVFDYVRGLTAIGPRLTGTTAYRRAAEWTADELRAAGVDRVALEPFSIADGWERERAGAQIVAPVARTLHVAALGWTPSTPADGLEAEVIAVSELAPEKIAALRALAGRIVLLPAGDVGGNPSTVTRRRRDLDVALRDAGARAILSPDTDRDNALTARDRTVGATLGALPAAQIGREDADAIRRLLDRGPVRIALDLRNRITPGPVTVHNVIGEIRGREYPDQWVIVGAHLDSWDFAAAAQDNAAGVAMVLEAAHAIAGMKTRPRRSVRFALWGGEEQGQLGSGAYVSAHEAELNGFIANLNADAGTGRQIGWTSPGRLDVIDAVRPLVDPLLAPIGGVAFDSSMRYAFQSDGAPFIRAGIPLLDLNADDSTYEDIHHKDTDTIERVDAQNLAIGATIVAITAFVVADAPVRIADRIKKEQREGDPFRVASTKAC